MAWVGEGGHRLVDAVAAGYFLQTADGLEESAGPGHSPGPATVRPGAADSLLPAREAGEAEVRGRHQGEVRQQERLKQPLRQPRGDPVNTFHLPVGGEAGEEEREEHFSQHGERNSNKLEQRAARPPFPPHGQVLQSPTLRLSPVKLLEPPDEQEFFSYCL